MVVDLKRYVRRHAGSDARVTQVAVLGRGQDQVEKGFGYGDPVRVDYVVGGRTESLVLHTQRPDAFGHDRRSDRVASTLLAYERSREIPRHVRPIDVGVLGPDGTFEPLPAGEPCLVTTFAPGRLYAETLRAIAARDAAAPSDLACVDVLARYLAMLHSKRLDARDAYVRSIRDTIGGGEGVFGVVDGYTADDGVAPPSRLQAIEHAAVEWRWKLRSAAQERACRIHGDFHPFNILFDDEVGLSLLDCSRGCVGDAADDVTCLSVNFIFFALLARDTWSGALRDLWDHFWATYLTARKDDGLASVVAPFFAWRLLVLASKIWYPATRDDVRDRLLLLAERWLSGVPFDPLRVDVLWAT
ncbi:MAG: phosphotransferase [Deltaproteobacteria bacterium]|nr:phosphotransferase [Deltaproteobacteria bacterium]